MRKKLISIDFDGVLNSYVSGWTGAADCLDAPVPGAMKFLADLVADDRFDAVVYSSRCASEEGVAAIRQWLDRHLVEALGEHAGRYVGNRVRVASSKPPAFVSLDDRVICFDGTWPTLDAVAAFVPWNKKPAGSEYSFDDMNFWKSEKERIDRMTAALKKEIGGDRNNAAQFGAMVDYATILERRSRGLSVDEMREIPDDFDVRAAKGFDPDVTMEDREALEGGD